MIIFVGRKAFDVTKLDGANIATLVILGALSIFWYGCPADTRQTS